MQTAMLDTDGQPKVAEMLDCKTVRIFAYSGTREQSNKRSGTRLKTESRTGERRETFFFLLPHSLEASVIPWDFFEKSKPPI